MSYTKGPWEWTNNNGLKRLSTKEKDGGVIDAYLCKGGVCDLAVQYDNMKLIEAAPDMAEALSDALSVINGMEAILYGELSQDWGEHHAADWCAVRAAEDKARAALAKAGL